MYTEYVVTEESARHYIVIPVQARIQTSVIFWLAARAAIRAQPE